MNTFRKFKIDWINHAVGFFSALFGIYIAFRLENYRDDIKEKEKANVVKLVLKKEIEENLRIYKTNADSLSNWLEYQDFIEKKNDQTKGGLVIGAIEYSEITKRQPRRFAHLKEIKSINDTLKVYDFDLKIDVAPVIGISSSNWKTAVASGILNSMDYELTTKLSRIYDWTDKDIGTSESELFENF